MADAIPRRRPTRFALILVLAFLLGLFTILIRSRSAEEAPLSADLATRRTILVLGVDDLAAESPRLVGVWEATFQEERREVFLLGWAADVEVCAPEAQPLDQLFEWSAERGVNPQFLAALDGERLFPPQVIIVADEVAFRALIDWRGGAEISGAPLTGTQVVAVLRPLYGNPSGALAIQEQIAGSLSRKLPSLGERLDLDWVAPLMPDHLYMSHSVQEVLRFLLPLTPLDTVPVWVSTLSAGEIRCES
jgi:hypothetical protein